MQVGDVAHYHIRYKKCNDGVPLSTYIKFIETTLGNVNVMINVHMIGKDDIQKEKRGFAEMSDLTKRIVYPESKLWEWFPYKKEVPKQN